MELGPVDDAETEDSETGAELDAMPAEDEDGPAGAEELGLEPVDDEDAAADRLSDGPAEDEAVVDGVAMSASADVLLPSLEALVGMEYVDGKGKLEGREYVEGSG